MATLKIELPNDMNMQAFAAQVNILARNLGFQPLFGGVNRIKLIERNPNAVDQKLKRHLTGIPTLRTLADGSKIGGAIRSNHFDDVPPGAA